MLNSARRWTKNRVEGGRSRRCRSRILRRQSSATAFLRPALEGGNVLLLTDAPVTKLNLEGTRCTGVTYLHNGEPVSIRAGREVVLSAGAIDSPRLLGATSSLC